MPTAIAKSCHAKPASSNRPGGLAGRASSSAKPPTVPEITPALANALDEPPIAIIMPYLDSLGMSYRRSKGLMAEVSKIVGQRKIRIDPIQRGGEVFGSRYTFHQPTPELLDALDKYDGCIARFDIAFDIFPLDMSVALMSSLIRANTFLRWRRPQPMFEIGGTRYWGQHHRAKKPPDRNLAEYHDEPSKLDGRPTVHLELRFQTSDAVKAEKLHLPSRLKSLNPRELFDKHVRIIDFQQHVSSDIMDSDHRDRTRGFYRRFPHTSCAQLFKDVQAGIAKSLDVLNSRFMIGDHLTWGATSGSKDQLTWVSLGHSDQLPSSASIVSQPTGAALP